MAGILLLNGPNLNLLGTREPEKYGSVRLEDIVRHCQELLERDGHHLEHFQTQSEAELLNRIHQAYGKIDGIVINPAAFTHTSIALRDALLAVDIPFIEIHLSNTFSREAYRHHSYLSDISKGVIVGFGDFGYELAIKGILNHLRKQ
ncbi:MAG: type II 3-dehydroquinate dehydratase [bacterium]